LWTKPARGPGRVEWFPLQKVDGSKVFYHWTSDATAADYLKAGALSAMDMQHFNMLRNDGLQSYGPGFYVSANPFDASRFGTKSVVVKPPGEGLLLLPDSLEPRSTEDARKWIEKLKAAGVTGASIANNDVAWYTFFDNHAVAAIKPFESGAYLDTAFRAWTKPSAEAETALQHIVAGKPLTTADSLALTSGDLTHIPLEVDKLLSERLSQAVDRQDGHSAAALIAQMDFWASTSQPPNADILGQLSKSLAAASDEDLRRLLPRLDSVVGRAGAYKQDFPLSSELALRMEKTAGGDAAARNLALGLGGWTSDPRPDYLQALAKDLNVSTETAAQFQKGLRATRMGSHGEELVSGLSGVKIPNAEALSLLGAAKDNDRLFGVAIQLAGHSDKPDEQLVRAFLDVFESKDFGRIYSAQLGAKALVLSDPALRERLKPIFQEWFARNNGSDYFTGMARDTLLKAAGLTEADLQGAAGCAKEYGQIK
jgi:hypothetical protein